MENFTNNLIRNIQYIKWVTTFKMQQVDLESKRSQASWIVVSVWLYLALYHTQYLESFLRSQFYMLRMDGPLPLPHRHYIAIMVRSLPVLCSRDFVLI